MRQQQIAGLLLQVTLHQGKGVLRWWCGRSDSAALGQKLGIPRTNGFLFVCFGFVVVLQSMNPGALT